MEPLRQRRIVGSGNSEYNESSSWNGTVISDNINLIKKRNSKELDGRLVFFSLAIFYCALVTVINIRVHSYPDAKMVRGSLKTDFIEEHARNHLNKITGPGARVAGSAEAIQAQKYISDQLNKIAKHTKPSKMVTVDVQTTSGSLALDFIGMGEFTNVYENVVNVIAKLSPKKPAEHSVLINCHYDSVIDSPGASDSAVSCCLMLEILRALSQQDEPLTHEIIFLFNGAEEDIMQASHGFITQHPWAKNIGAFVNLDSAGAGGWEIVFQTGPEHPWLVKAYASSAVYPCGSVFSQELFNSGLIPSDTDYRIFRDFGNIAGLDIAHIQNGFVYHTSNDIADMVAPGCMQRGGENLMSLLKTLATSSQVIDPGDDKHGNMVFFDFIGLFMVYYPQQVAIIINWLVVVVMLIYFGKKVSSGKVGFQNYLFKLLVAVLAVTVTWLITLACILLMAGIVLLLGRTMSWFTHKFNLIWLFILPGTASSLAFHIFLKRKIYKDWSGWKTESLFFDANLFIWMLFLALLTYNKIMSSYFALLWIVFPGLVRTVLYKFMKRAMSGNSRTLFAVNVAAIFIPAVYHVYITHTVFMLFIPIMGRLPAVNPEITIAIMTALTVIIYLTPHIGLVYICRRMRNVVIGMAIVSLVGIATLLLTPLGFPFTSDKTVGSQQKSYILHLDRRFHAADDKFESKSSIWYIPFDFHGTRLIEKHNPDVFMNSTEVQCEGTYCGRPYILPVVTMYRPGYCVEVPAPPLNLKERLILKLVKKEALTSNIVKITFHVSGPDHRNCYITPRNGVSLRRWSVGNGYPNPTKTEPIFNQTTYFLYYSHGEDSSGIWKFNVEFYVDDKHPDSEPIVDIAFAGHYHHGDKKTTPALRSFINKLPPWSVPVYWAATYDSFIF